jgi:predicted nucleotidyltransferase
VRSERLAGAELEAYIGAVTAALVRDLEPERIVLFGSFARGDQNRASDLDLVVIMATQLPFCERIGRALESACRASRRLPVEPLVYTPEEWRRMQAAGSSFTALVRSEGRVLYERESQPERGAAVAEAGSA